jgi:hypothetical protein
MSGAGTAGASPTPTFEGCAAWDLQIAPNATSTITQTDGGVLLSRPGDDPTTDPVFNNSDVAISQTGLTGDFDVRVTFEDFQPGDAHPVQGPVLEAGAWIRASDGFINQATGVVGAGDGEVAVIVPYDDTPIVALSPLPADGALVGASGSIEIIRKDGIFTSTIVVNGVTDTVSSTTPYLGEPMTFFIGIGLLGESQGDADASVKVTGVTVTGGGGGVLSDSFDCAM